MFLFELRGFGELLWLAKMNSGLRLYADQMRGNHVICTKNHQVGVKISWQIRELAGSSKDTDESARYFDILLSLRALNSGSLVSTSNLNRLGIS